MSAPVTFLPSPLETLNGVLPVGSQGAHTPFKEAKFKELPYAERLQLSRDFTAIRGQGFASLLFTALSSVLRIRPRIGDIE